MQVRFDCAAWCTEHASCPLLGPQRAVVAHMHGQLQVHGYVPNLILRNNPK